MNITIYNIPVPNRYIQITMSYHGFDTESFDRSKTYYMVTNYESTYNGYKYEPGLNILHKKFPPNGYQYMDHTKYLRIKKSDEYDFDGTFSFVDEERLPRLWMIGQHYKQAYWIIKVTIPEDAQLAGEPDQDPPKFRADKVILGPWVRYEFMYSDNESDD